MESLHESRRHDNQDKSSQYGPIFWKVKCSIFGIIIQNYREIVQGSYGILK